jgi:ethanolamine permease
VLLNPAVIGVGAFKLGSSGEPLLDGFRAIYGDAGAVLLGLIALVGLIASFHTIVFAMGRQVYSLARAGYFPNALSVTHSTHKTPHVAMIAGAVLGLAIMMIMWFALGGAAAGSLIGSVLLNMAVFGAMCSYIAQAVSFILLRQNQPNMTRPYRSPFGIPGAVVTIVIALITLFYQVQDPNFTKGVIWVIVWFAIGIVYFALVGRHKLILSPEEEFALEHKA